MTRTDPVASSASWGTKSSAATDDGNRIGQDPRPRGRIRRSMTACHTCRKLKTRCDLDPRGHACRRCLSLRLECELPETQDRFQDNASTWSDANAAMPSFEERLNSLERSMGEMIDLMRQIVNQSFNGRGSPSSHVSRSVDEMTPNDGGAVPSFTLKPIQLIRDLQVECLSGGNNLSSDMDHQGDVVPQGLIDAKFSLKLIELFAEYFGPWVSIDLSTSIQRRDTLLFNTACLLASQCMPGMSPNTVQEISLQVQHAVTKALWHRSPLTTELLQALALLCLYPTSGHKEESMDGWLLSGLSINHALIPFGFLHQPPGKSLMRDETLSQLRLWNTFCLAHLQCPQYLDQCSHILDHPGATPGDGRIVAEIHLYRITLKLQNNPQRLRLTEAEYEELERWKLEWAHLLTNEGHSTLELNLCFCQLLLHRTATTLHPDSDRLTHEITSNARIILTRSLQTRLSAAPALINNVYYILGYVALTLCDYSPQDQLLEQVRAFLLHLAPSSDHIAYRIAYIVGKMQRRCSAAASMSRSSPAADVLKNTVFGPPPPPPSRNENLDLSHLITVAGAMDALIDSYGCFEQILPNGYMPPQPAYSASGMFQQHSASVIVY